MKDYAVHKLQQLIITRFNYIDQTTQYKTPNVLFPRKVCWLFVVKYCQNKQNECFLSHVFSTQMIKCDSIDMHQTC